MKRIVFGSVIAICTFFVGFGLERLFAGAYSKIWPEIPATEHPADIAIYDVELCDLVQNHGAYGGRLIKLKLRRESVSWTILGFLGTNACEGLVRVQCPEKQACSAVPNLIGETERAKKDVEITGKFLLDHMFGDHAIEIHKIVETPPLVSCPDGSKVEEGTECPAAFHDEIDLRIAGIDIGSRHREVIKALGQPIKSVRGRYHEGSSEHELTLKYDGLSIDLLYVPDRVVVAFQVTSRKWNVAGIRVGDDESVLKSRFGASLYGPVEDPDVKGGYVYASDTGPYVTIKVINGKIAEIWAAMPTC